MRSLKGQFCWLQCSVYTKSTVGAKFGGLLTDFSLEDVNMAENQPYMTVN